MCAKLPRTYQVSQTVKLLAHHAALLPPPGHPAVHEVEEKPKRQEGERVVQVRGVGRVTEAVAQAGEDGHDAAEAVQRREEVGHVERPYQREVARVGGEQEPLLVELGLVERSTTAAAAGGGRERRVLPRATPGRAVAAAAAARRHGFGPAPMGHLRGAVTSVCCRRDQGKRLIEGPGISRDVVPYPRDLGFACVAAFLAVGEQR